MKKNKTKWYLEITPEELWNEYVPNSVELFISNFNYDNPPVTDINKMCKIYSREICNSLGKPYTEEQREHFENLLKEYICGYIKKVGGYDKLRLYTEEQVDAIDEEDVRSLFNDLYKLERKYEQE